jgi:surfactin family lipopeptide synthetase C
VPAAFVSLEQLPLTVNGKVDRKALPAAELSGVIEEYVGPRNAVEEELCRIWSEVLKVERVGVDDNFFELGGHSLLATMVVASIQEILQVEVKLRTLFENPTIAELAETLLQNPEERELIERAAELAIQLNQLSNEEIELLLAEAPA